jgi:hypothetical protein
VRGAIASTYADQAKRANGPSPSVVVTNSLDLLEKEADPRVRGLLIEVIGPSCASDPRVMQALAAHFRREHDPMLLKLIGKYVPADKLGT